MNLHELCMPKVCYQAKERILFVSLGLHLTETVHLPGSSL